jgi:hypothetical protein
MIEFGKWEIHFEMDLLNGEECIYIINRQADGIGILTGDTMTFHKKGTKWKPEPFIRIGRNHDGLLQALADALYERGIHPKQRRFEDEMKLMDNHLQDMRNLVFKKK